MSKSIYALMGVIVFALASIVPWADAQQKPSNVLIWCQNTNGTSSPCVAGNSLDYDSGGGTVNQGTVGIALPASGGPVAGGTSTNPIRVDPTGTTTQPVSGTVTANAGTNLNTSSLLTTTAHDAAFGTAGTADTQVRTIQGIASMVPLAVSQSGTWNIGAVTTLPALPSNQSVNVAQMNGVATSMGNGASGTGTQRVTEATDSQLSAGVGATGDAAATAGSTGSVTAKLRLMTSQLDTISTAVAAIQTATQLIDDDQTGATGLSYISVGTTEDEHAVKASAGRLFSITATNTNAAVRYLKCENDTAANTAPGTDTPEIRIAIPGATTGAGFTANFGPAGVAFSNGLTCWLVTGAADSDVAEVAANEIMVFYTYK